MVKRKVLTFLCLVSVVAMIWGANQVLAQQAQGQGIERPRKDHDIEYVKQRRARVVTLEQRQAAAARRAAKHSQDNPSGLTTTGSNTVTSDSGRGTK